MKKTTVSAYAICFNEEAFLPYYLRWYTSFCDKVVVYDNYSTDKSVEIIKSYPNTEVRFYDSGNRARDTLYTQIKNSCWRESKSDYVIIGDIDEILYHPNILGYLEKNKEYSIIESKPYEMWFDRFPTENKQIFEIVKTGALRGAPRKFQKKCIFDPQRVEINYEHGCHRSSPTGDVKNLSVEDTEMKFLHYKYLGLNHCINRFVKIKERQILEDGKINNIPLANLTPKSITKDFTRIKGLAKKIL